MSQWDEVTGEQREYPSKRQPRRARGSSYKPQKDTPLVRPSQQKPGEVSDAVWGLAEHFLESGRAAFGRHLPVSRAEFSKRLSERINTDPDVLAMLRPLEWNEDHRLTRTRLPEAEFRIRVDRINDIVAEMINLFWRSLEAGATNSGGLQFRFLDVDWAQLWYDATTNLQVRKLVEGLGNGDTKRVEGNYRMVSEESRAAHRMKRLQIRLRRRQERPDRAPLTDQDRATFEDWLVADRKRTRDSVAN